METVALFGGSFDPPHIAHEMIVKEALKINDVEKVIVMPTFLNPFKNTFIAPPSLRLQWLKKIFKPFDNVIVSDFEINKNKKVPTMETVNFLLRQYKKIYLILGADNLRNLHTWHQYDKLQKLVTFVIATRYNEVVSNSYLKLNISEDISSTQLRENIQEAYLPDVCAKEILKFYKEHNEK